MHLLQFKIELPGWLGVREKDRNEEEENLHFYGNKKGALQNGKQ